MDFFAVPYDIHFDDTMAYGSHHFLTNFKFQCAGREHLLFSPHAFEEPEFRRDFDQVLLLTYEGYSRNLAPAALGDRLIILTSLEERGEVSLRFCFRTLKSDGTPVACGYQTVLCADRQGALRAFPASFQRSFESLAALHEPTGSKSFRDLALQGGGGVQALFPEAVRELARTLLADTAPRGVSRMVRIPESVPAPGLQLPANATAFLFAGQGTFEPALFLQLKALQPELRDELLAVNEACRSQGIDVGPLLAAEDVTQVGRALDAAPLLDQLGIFLSGVLGARWMERQGTRPDVFVGHSFGEIAAMTAAGAMDLRTGAEVVCRRIRALQTVPDDLGTLAAVALSEPETVRAVAECGARTLEIAGRNHSRQTVVAGPREELERLRAFLERQGKGFTFISSRYPFHHPSLAPAVTAFRASLADLAVHPARGPVYSPIERRVYGRGGSELAGALASHLVRPFDFPGAVETLVGAGCARFVDCGTGGRLTRIVQRILPKDTSVAMTSVDRSLPVGPPAVTPFARDAAPVVPAIAVVSLGCMLPGGAKDPETYWRNIQRGISGIVDTGVSHPDQVVDFVGPAVTPDRTYTLLTGRVLDSDLVPPPGITPDRFQRYGREQRLLAIALSQVMESLRSTAPRAPGRIQCLLGSTADGSPEYDDSLCVEAGEALLRARGETARDFSALMREALGVTATSSELAPHPTLQSVVTDVVGPSVSTMLLDAACASSLYAIALGMKALERGEADLVLAGGVFSPSPGNSCLFSQFKGLSATGSRPFDERADGVIFGEGAGVVGLMRLEDAVSAGLKVHAVIRGAGLSSDGRSSSANVPRADGQVAAMEACYAAAGVETASIQYIEAHGTATPAGDTTELQSIGRVFGGKRKGLQLASVKALIGHVGWAAGAASVIKLCKALEHRSFPPQSHFDRPGAGLRALGPDFEVSTREQPWPENGDHPRRAATNGFGFGGTNAHLVLEEYRGGPLAPRACAMPSLSEELVVVAAEGMFPEVRFDAKGMRLPASVRLLPDITEDMDLTQHLGLIVASDVVKKLGTFDSLRTGTAIVLGLEGKTRRGVEATQRVLADSTRRRLREHVQRASDSARLLPLVDRLHAAVGALRPSGPYTLQGMMPNVTPGRVAGALDTKGPNFVVDAGAGTLAASLRASRALLDSGFELVLVGSAHVKRPGEGPAVSAPEEGMTMLAVTTAAKAEAHGLKPLCHLRMSEEAGSGAGPGVTLPPHSAREAQDVLSAVRAAAEGQAITLRFHPDAATGARLVLQLHPGISARPGAPKEQTVAVGSPSTERRDLETSARPSDMTTISGAENRELRGSAPSAAGRENLSDSRTGLENHGREGLPLQPGRENLSDSRTGLKNHGREGLPLQPGGGNLSDSRTGLENPVGREGRPLQSSQENLSDSRTGLESHGRDGLPLRPGHGNLSDSRTGLGRSGPEAGSLDVRGTGAPFAPGAIATVTESATSIPEASDGFDHSAPIRYHAPVLVERPALTTRASPLRGQRVLFIAQDEAVARELSAQAHDICGPEFRILHSGASDAGARIHGIDLTREETAEANLAALGFEPQVIISVCRMSSEESESSVVADTALRHEALELLFLSARRAYEGLSAGTVTLASLCIGGVGARRTMHPVTGLFAGLLKSLGREVPARGIRAIATGPLPLRTALDHVASELGTGDNTAPVEVCFDGSVRCVRLLQPTDVPARPAVTLDSHSVVLLTGGGRGVTAVLAGALLKRYGCKVVLLGRSDPSDAPARVLQASDEELGAVEREFYASELARDSTVRMPALRARFERHLAVRELRATLNGLMRLPGQMTYRAADVTRPEDVDRVVEELIREHGRLDLVVHGAGTQVSKKLHRRRLTELRSTLDTKLLGLRNLRESCARRLPAPVPFHVLTSAFSYIGNDGQADYGAANEALDRLCAWVSDARQDVQWCSVGWLAWDGIGMTRGSEYRVLGASRRLRGIRADEGEALFLQLVDGQPVQPINVQLTESERGFYGLEVIAPPAPTPEPPRPTRRDLTIDAASVPCLEDHLVRGTPTLPGAWALDLMFQAALDDTRPELRTVTIEDVRFSRFIRVKPGGQQSLRAECTPLTDAPGQHSVQVKLTGDIVHASGVVLERDLVYAEARFTLTAEPPRSPHRLEAAHASGHGMAVHDPHCATGSPIELRRMFDCLEEIRLEEDARFARLGLPESPRQAGHGVPALVLDAALRLSAMHVEGVSNDVFAPVGVQRATFDRDLVAHDSRAPRSLTLKSLAPRVEGDLLQCGTVAAHDEAGRLRMLVEGGIARPMA
ncbi:SDR family NAD(P)-dependent oxidoreductase [Corallococcus sp. AB032C]|uniref:type I polyketide synthase n=1 Tax=Corallococcus TaxID=83461 RepID=UPI000EC137E6|nr:MULTISPECIES: type I polyketide synthase [Corallococcus]NPC46093.1 SDR family NAD(P)-dependent oxidoreductase [Corallococcus exiguus]RKH86794.1 SDR family NAD(P)-dependent oxidoreductase [Corallococcus sp. AB032C]